MSAVTSISVADARSDLAELLNRVERCLLQLRMRRQAEVIVGREIDDRLVIDRRVRLLLPVEHAQMAIEPLVAEGVQFVIEIGERVGAHDAPLLNSQMPNPKPQIPKSRRANVGIRDLGFGIWDLD